MQSRRWGLWAWGVTAPVVLVALVVMWAEPGACDAKLISNTASAPSANCFEFWLNRYQTMISGLLALSAAVVAYLAARAQIRHAERLEEKRRQAEELAARARLSYALDEVYSYTKICIGKFAEILSRLRSGSLYVTFPASMPSPLSFPDFTNDSIEAMRNCIRFANDDKIFQIANLMSQLQIYQASMLELKIPHEIHPLEVYNRIIDAYHLRLLAGDLFDYARLRNLGLQGRPAYELMKIGFLRDGFTEEEHPDLYWTLYAQKSNFTGSFNLL